MTASTPLNSVLLHPQSRCGANISAWLGSGCDSSGNNNNSHCDNRGGKGLENALRSPEKIISIIKKADLKGLGGSGYPAHNKWRFVANQPTTGDRHLICNGNEDEPGTFKDRILLEETPHQVIEGALIAALATRVNRIIFYINPAHVNALKTMQLAVTQWQSSAFIPLIEQQLKTVIHLSVVASSGHYIGGEETAAIESIEGNFPFPRGKPPFPSSQGIHHQPTLINNVETLANVPHILREGASWFQSLGLGKSSGTKLYCLSGDVMTPGLFELPMGTPLNTLITEYGGGLRNNKEARCAFVGGPSNAILMPKNFTTALDFESLAKQNGSLGTGAMIIVGEGASIIEHAATYVQFFANAACGQCAPCKSGTFHLHVLLNKFVKKQASRDDLNTLVNLTKMLPGSGRCHLPDGAAKMLNSVLHHFLPEFEQALQSHNY